MKIDTADTYALRRDQYERREHMITWVAAGIASLVAFVAARPLEGAPRCFLQVFFTLALAAGFCAAFARVGFEWKGTVLKRKLIKNPTLEGKVLEASDQEWPKGPEASWITALLTIAAAGIVMLVGIWWPRTQPVQPLPPPPPPVVSSRTELPAISIGAVGPFADCNVDLPSASDGQLNLLIQQYRDHMSSSTRAALIILVGTADNHRLSRRCAAKFGTNENLAVMRANRVRDELEKKLAKEPLPPRFSVLTSGPRHLEADKEGKERQLDRAVSGYLVLDLLTEAPKQKL
jgi:hypothetical protein